MSKSKRLFGTIEILKNQRVIKHYNSDSVSQELFFNELKWYLRFNKTETRCTPELLDFHQDLLELEYIGPSLSKDTNIADLKNQLRHIASFLQVNQCQHCDITPSNLLVSENKIFIIDFGFAIEMGQNPYKKWKKIEKSMLDSMGYIYRAPDWPNDHFSLTRVYQEISGHPEGRLFAN